MFDIEKQEMYEQMNELENKIKDLGNGILNSDTGVENSPNKRALKNNITPKNKTIPSSSNISKYKTMIQEKFEIIAKERSK